MKNHMTRFLSRVLVLLMMLQLVSVGPVFATSASAENDEAEQEEILANDAEIADVWRTAMWGKLAGHGIDEPGFLQPDRPMSAIGG